MSSASDSDEGDSRSPSAGVLARGSATSTRPHRARAAPGRPSRVQALLAAHRRQRQREASQQQQKQQASRLRDESRVVAPTPAPAPTTVQPDVSPKRSTTRPLRTARLEAFFKPALAPESPFRERRRGSTKVMQSTRHGAQRLPVPGRSSSVKSGAAESMDVHSDVDMVGASTLVTHSKEALPGPSRRDAMHRNISRSSSPSHARAVSTAPTLFPDQQQRQVRASCEVAFCSCGVTHVGGAGDCQDWRRCFPGATICINDV